MFINEAVPRLLIIDVPHRRWWWDFRWLPPTSSAATRAAALRDLRRFVANAFHDSSITDFGPAVEEVRPDADGWRTLPPLRPSTPTVPVPERIEDEHLFPPGGALRPELGEE